MNKSLIIAAGLLLAPGLAAAQDRTRLYTRPALPTAGELDRLHLKMAWRAYVPTGGRLDGLFSVQLLGKQLLVQTRSGGIYCLGADDGITQWSANVGMPYRLTHRLTANSKSIFAVRGTTLYDFDRQTGRVRWSHEMPGMLSASPAADEQRLYVCLGTGRMLVYELPEAIQYEQAKLAAAAAAGEKGAETKLEELKRRRESYSSFGVRGVASASIGPLSSARDARQTARNGIEPLLLFDYKADTRLEQTPVVTEDQIVLAGSDGTYVVLSKLNAEPPRMFHTGGMLSAPPGHHFELNEEDHPVDIAYVASRDYNVYAVNTWRGRTDWRFTAGGPLMHRPDVTDDDVYIRAEGTGLYRVDRRTGDRLWFNPSAERFLAMNKKYVYAADRQDRLLVLDRATGSRRGVLDTRGYVVPISNEWTDRCFLGSHDGLIVCLHDRDYPTPQTIKTVPERKAPPKKAEDKPKETDKAEDKPKEDMKDEPKKEEPKKPAPKPPAKAPEKPKQDK